VTTVRRLIPPPHLAPEGSLTALEVEVIADSFDTKSNDFGVINGIGLTPCPVATPGCA